MEKIFKAKTGKVLRIVRKKNNLSQEKVASLLEKDQSQISRIERGLDDIRFSEVNTLCNHFKISLFDFVAEVKYSKIE